MAAPESDSSRPAVLVVGASTAVETTVDASIQALYDCRFSAGAGDAMRIATGQRFAAVILFPLGDGAEPDLGLLRALGAAQPAAARVLVTADEDPAAAERAFAAGAHSCLLLPLSPRQLAISISGRLRQCRTERSKNERLRGFQDRVEEMMSKAPVPIVIKDLEGRYVFANERAHQFAGRRPGELLGRTVRDLLPDEAAAEEMAEDHLILERGNAREGERSFNVRGEQRTYLLNKFPYRNEDGELTGIFGMATDITDRKVSEALRAAFSAEQRNLIFELRRSREETVDRLVRALHSRDVISGEHVSRMAVVAAYLGELTGLEPDRVILLRAAAPMHDVGKIAIRDEVLQKPGRLSADERVEMEHHARLGFEILDGSQSEVLRVGAQIALTHHENWDGSGYPRGLRGEEIPIEGRIAAVADVFDALLSQRPYREAMPPQRVREVIAEGRGSFFDPEIVDALLDNFDTALLVRNADGGVSDEKLRLFIEPSKRAA